MTGKLFVVVFVCFLFTGSAQSDDLEAFKCMHQLNGTEERYCRGRLCCEFASQLTKYENCRICSENYICCQPFYCCSDVHINARADPDVHQSKVFFHILPLLAIVIIYLVYVLYGLQKRQRLIQDAEFDYKVHIISDGNRSVLVRELLRADERSSRSSPMPPPPPYSTLDHVPPRTLPPNSISSALRHQRDRGLPRTTVPWNAVI